MLAPCVVTCLRSYHCMVVDLQFISVLLPIPDSPGKEPCVTSGNISYRGVPQY